MFGLEEIPVKGYLTKTLPGPDIMFGLEEIPEGLFN